MNEPDSGAAPVGSPPPPPPHKDRSAGLVVFGILTILLGCLAGLFVLLMMAQVAFGGAMKQTVGLSEILPAMSIYGILAAALVWTGIGSIMARRWARALLLISSWIWLVMGVFILVFMVFFIPHILALASSAGTTNQPVSNTVTAAMDMVMLFVFLVMGVLFVILPVIWVYFYSSRHVKATCEKRDPVTRWTDACPLPVLGLCLMSVIGAPMMLMMPFTGHCVMPFFGVFLTGPAGGLFCLAVAAVWTYAAWSLYKLERRGWWVIFIAICVLSASAVVTFARHDMLEMYRLMNYPEAQIEQMQKSGLLVGNGMEWMTLCSMLPLLGYLVFIRKYLRR
jgi:hypothetical protein